MWTNPNIRTLEEWKHEIPVLELSKDDEYSYIFQYDLEYPKEAHDYYKDLPFAPKIIIIDSVSY